MQRIIKCTLKRHHLLWNWLHSGSPLLKIILFSLIITINHSSSAQSQVINIITEQAAPLNYLDPEDSIIKGFSTEIIRLVMDDTGLEYNLSVHPWARALSNAINTPNTLIYSIGRVPSRETKFIWLKKIIDLKYKLYTLNDELNNVSLETIKSLPVAVQRGDVSHLELVKQGFNNFVFLSFDDYNQVNELLRRKRIAILSASNLWLSKYMEHIDPQFKLKQIKAYEAEAIELYFAINSQTEEAIVNKIKNSFNKIDELGIIKTIVKPFQ